ncbi:MAG: HAMP domain-containing methyl-accepting chemotaxis protein [Thermodesulfobacteriota bacterium]
MKNLKLGAKIGGGFGLMILIAMVLGGLAVINMTKASGNAEMMAVEYAPEVRVASDIERSVFKLIYEVRGYAFSEDKKFLEMSRQDIKEVYKHLAEAKRLAAASAHLIKLREAINKIEDDFKRYESLVNETEAIDNAIDAARGRMDEAAKQFIDNCNSFLGDQNRMMEREIVEKADVNKLSERHRKITLLNDIIDLGNMVRVANFKSQAMRDPQIVLEAFPAFTRIDAKVAEIAPLVHQERNLQQLKGIQGAAQAYAKTINDQLANNKTLAELNSKRTQLAMALLKQVQDTANAGITSTLELANEAVQGLQLSVWVMVVGLLVALVLGVVVAWLITRSITAPIRVTVDAVGQAAKGDFSFGLDKRLLTRGDELGEMLRDVDKMAENLSVVVTESTAAAETVATSAGEISQGNQDLSERTQQQASAIEETASSIEEMTSSVKQNAGNSQQANDLARRTSAMAVQGGQVVERTVGAMAAVTESSRKISDIINVVNEIAFQTNLLALNAAVEAARAGEAGRGFAVVAGEVRNLAGRSAAAAKEIQALITDSVAKVEQGNELVAESGALLREIITSVQGVADTVAEITAASQEQASGIEEINRAVTQMDEAVQQNAALVEEAASASENMAAAAEQLRAQMRQFKVRQMAGAGQATFTSPRPPAPKPAARSASKPAAAAAPAKPVAKPDSKPAAKQKDDFFDNADLEGFEEF